MTRLKLTQQQTELITLIPEAIRNSKDFTNAAKLVLAQIDLQDGTDYSEENGYVFASNKQLMKYTGIGSEHTIINAVKQLVNAGLIETRRGYRNKDEKMASEYVLTDKYYELQGRENPHKVGCNNHQNEGCNNSDIGCNNYCNCDTAINPTIEAMQQQINELLKMNEKLQTELQKFYCSTESDTETDTDTCKLDNVYINKKYNSNCNSNTVTVNNTCTVQDRIKKKKKKINKKEKESCSSSSDSDRTLEENNSFNLNLDIKQDNSMQRGSVPEQRLDSENDIFQKRMDIQTNSEATEDTATSSVRIGKGIIKLNTSKDIEDYQSNSETENTATPSVRSCEENNELHTSNNMKELQSNSEATEDTATPSVRIGKEKIKLNTSNNIKEFQNMGDDSHPSTCGSDSEELEISAADTDNCTGSLLNDNVLPDGVLYHLEKKRSPKAPGCKIDASCDRAAITNEAVNAVLHVLDEFNTGGVKVTEYKPHMYTVELGNSVVWTDFIEELHNYIDRNKIYTKFDLRKNNKGKQYKKFRICTS